MVASALRKDEYIVIDGQACKIVKIEASQSSISVEGIDIFTDELHKCTLHTNDNVDVPTVASNEYKLVCLVLGSWIGRKLNYSRSTLTKGFYALRPRQQTSKKTSWSPVATLDRRSLATSMKGKILVCHIYHITRLGDKLTKYPIVVTVHKAMGDEQATSYKEASE